MQMGFYDWGNMKNSIFSESTLVSGSVFSSVFLFVLDTPMTLNG